MEDSEMPDDVEESMGLLEEGQEEEQEEGAEPLKAPTLLQHKLLLTDKLRRPR